MVIRDECCIDESTQSVSDHKHEPNRLAECVHAHHIRCIICMMEQSNLTLHRLESCVMAVAYSVIERSTSHAVKLHVRKRRSCCSHHLIKLADISGMVDIVNDEIIYSKNSIIRTIIEMFRISLLMDNGTENFFLKNIYSQEN